MSLTLYAHPFAAYCWKTLIALYENATPFTYRVVEDAAGWAELESLWPLRKFPVLRDGDDVVVVESSVIIEYLMLRHPGRVRLIPENADAAMQVRFLDRFFDNYVMTPMQTLVSNRMRPEAERDAKGIGDPRKLLEVAYRWLDERVAKQQWASGSDFTLADCAAAPSLFYADWVHPIGEQIFPGCANIARSCWPGRRFPAPWRRRGLIGTSFRSGAPDRD